MLSSTDLKKIVAEARPLIEQQLDLAEQIAGLREVVTAHGGDWSQLKALIKAQVQDERDDAGDGKRVRKILDRADYAKGYADMLGLANLNEFSFSDDDEVPPADATQHAADSGSASSVPSDGAAAPIPEIPAGSPVSDDRQPAQVAAAASADHRLGEGPEAASREPKGPAKADAVESASEPTNVTPIRRNWKWTDPAHPDCLDPGTCGGFSNMALCGRCKEAAAALHVA
jgi:hypothetical protein